MHLKILLNKNDNQTINKQQYNKKQTNNCNYKSNLNKRININMMNDDKKQNIINDELDTTKTLEITTTNIEASNLTTTTNANTNRKTPTINNPPKNVFNNKNNIIIKNSNIIMGSPSTQQQQNDNDTIIINQLYLINNKNELLDPDPKKQQEEEEQVDEEEVGEILGEEVENIEEEDKQKLKEHEVFDDTQQEEVIQEEELFLEKQQNKEGEEELNEANFSELNNSSTRTKTIIINNLNKENVLDLQQQQQQQQQQQKQQKITTLPKELIDNLLVQVESHEMESSSPSSSASSSPTSSPTSQTATSTMLQKPTTTSAAKIIKDKNNKMLKVEPLKINLNREPIKTIIKIPSDNLQTSTLSGTTTTLTLPKKLIIKPIVRTTSDINEQHNVIPKITIKSIINKTNSDYLLYNKSDDKLITSQIITTVPTTTTTATSPIIITNKNIVPASSSSSLTTHKIVTQTTSLIKQNPTNIIINPSSCSSSSVSSTTITSSTVANNLLTGSTGGVGGITTTTPTTTTSSSTTSIINDVIPKIKIKVDNQNCTTSGSSGSSNNGNNSGNGNLSGVIINNSNIINYNWETEYNDKTQKMSIKKTTQQPQNLDDFSNNKFKIITNKETSSSTILRSTPPPSLQSSSSSTQQPLIPKLTIKTTTTTDNKLETMIRTVSGGTSSGTSSPISKLKIKPIIKPNELTKFKIKTIEPPIYDINDTNELRQQNTIINETTIPKLIVKVTKDCNVDDKNCNTFLPLTKWKTNDVMTLTSETIITEPIVPKMLIRSVKTIHDEPIIIPKVTIKSILNNHLIDGISGSGSGINNTCSDILVSPKVTLKPIPKPIDSTQPLEIVTNLNVLEKGLDSPRIVLKINKTIATATTTSTVTNCINKQNDDLLINHKHQQKLGTTSGITIGSSSSGGGGDGCSSSNSSSSSSIHHNVNELKRNSSKIHKKKKIIDDDCDDDNIGINLIEDDDDDDDDDNDHNDTNKKIKLIKKLKIKANKKILLSGSSSNCSALSTSVSSTSGGSSSSSSSSSELSPHNIIQNDDCYETNILNNSLITKTKLEETKTNLTNILTNLHKSKKVDNKLITTAVTLPSSLTHNIPTNDINSFKRRTKTKRKKRSLVATGPPIVTESISIDDDDDDEEQINNSTKRKEINNQIISDDDNDVIIIEEDDDDIIQSGIIDAIDPLTINIDDKPIDINNKIKQKQQQSKQNIEEIAIQNLTPVKRGRGRPRKIPLIVASTTPISATLPITPSTITTTTTPSIIIPPPKTSSSSLSSPIIIIDENGCLSKDDKLKVNKDVNVKTTTKRKLETDNDNNDNIDNHDDIIETEVKEIKPRFVRNPNDEDTSPTFHPTYRTPRGRGRGQRGSRRGRGSRGPRGIRQGHTPNTNTPSDKMNDGVIWSTPETTTKSSVNRKKIGLSKITSTPVLQAFEEDTRMSGDMSQNQTAGRNIEFWSNEESQNSFMSSGSTTIEGEKKKHRGRMEVGDAEGKTDFTIDMIAEYEWPSQQTNDINSIKGRGDMYMIQEQVAEYLGVKSFKRKYPDLLRRSVEMEERNHLMEKGLVSEKMCDLGLTAVLAADILDIMFQDFHDKYEEYRKYYREKQTRDFSQKQKALKMEPVDKSQLARDKSLQSASEWNISFNKERKDNRRACMDLQNLIIQLPDSCRQKMLRPINNSSSDYPIALVPGQFSEYYKKYTPKELFCYPINTVLMNPSSLNERVKVPVRLNNNIKTSISDDDNGDDDDDDDSTQSDTDTSNCSSDTDSLSGTGSDDSNSTDSSDDDDDDDSIKCRVCDKSQNSNRDNKPECFIQCSSCRRKAHPSCIEMSPRMSKRALEYLWQCTECKQCCKCHRSTDEDKMLFCDQCDRGYHIYCIGLRMVPQGRWHCTLCSICTQCGTRNPEGHTNINANIKQQVAIVQWTHIYQYNHITKLREHSAMLCMPCARLKNDSEVR